MKMPKMKLNITWHTAAALIILLVLTVSLLANGLYARYKTVGESSDGARVARFKIGSTFPGDETSDQRITVDLRPGEVKTYEISIENSSEVAVRCELNVINTTQNLPLKFTLTRSDNSVEASDTCTLIEDFNPAVGTVTYKYTLTVELEDDSHVYHGLLDNIDIELHCRQID